MEQISIHRKDDSKLNTSISSHQTVSTTQTEEDDFESQSEIEYLSDDDDDDNDNDNDNDNDQLITSQTKEDDDDDDDLQIGFVSKYKIPFPKHISRFVLWQLLNVSITEQISDDNNKRNGSISEKGELKTEQDQNYNDNDNDKENENENENENKNENKNIDEKLMFHSKIISLKSASSDCIDYDNLNIIPGIIEPHRSNKIRKINVNYCHVK